MIELLAIVVRYVPRTESVDVAYEAGAEMSEPAFAQFTVLVDEKLL